jgi:hypothetical protein
MYTLDIYMHIQPTKGTHRHVEEAVVVGPRVQAVLPLVILWKRSAVEYNILYVQL